MNIFFKFLALGGIGGTAWGAFQLSKQSYQNLHISTTEKILEESQDADVDVKKQPETYLYTPKQEEKKEEKKEK